MLKQHLEDTTKLIAALTVIGRFLLLLGLSVFVVKAVADPPWARKKLREAGWSVKEVNVLGVRLASDDSFDMANALADVKARLEQQLRPIDGQPESRPDHRQIAQALQDLGTVQNLLTKQNETLQEVQKDAGVVFPPIPDAGWLYVGRLTEDKVLQAGPRIDVAGTKLENGSVKQVQLSSAAPVVDNGAECARTRIEDVQHSAPAELQRIQVLLVPAPGKPLQVQQTVSCPSIGNGKLLYAQVRIRKEDVKFAKFETLLRR